MSFTNSAKASISARIRDDLNGGAMLLVDGAGTSLVVVPLDSVSGSVSLSGVIALSGFPKSVTASAAGTLSATGGRFRTSSSVLYKQDMTVGVPGSGAQIIVDNGLGTLVISAGANITVGATQTPTFAPV
jgi:hypothetical protein